MEIKSLKNTETETIVTACMEAFADYELQLNAEELKSMWKRRGFDPELSFAAFEGDKIISYTLNGIGNFNGTRTAYDTGTGTLKEYRGQGWATRIFEYSIPFLKEAKISQYLLEVLQHNAKAVSVYRKIGFEVTREFNYFIWKNEEMDNQSKPLNSTYSIQPFDISQFYSLSGFWDFCPSWQNSFESIQRAQDNFISLGVFDGKQLTGYCVFEPISGDITQLAVDKLHRRKGVASALIREMCKMNKSTKMKLVNADTTCSSIVEFLKSINIGITGKQFEMVERI